MDIPKPPKPAHLLDDLEAIRELLEKDQLEPPLLTDSLDDDLQIPLLSDIIEPGPALASTAVPTPPPVVPPTVQAVVSRPQPSVPSPAAPAPAHSAPAPAVAVAAPTAANSIGQAVQRSLSTPSAAELNRLDSELRAAAQLILQDVIDDFVPQIEAELKRRLDARLDRLIKPPRA
ncbi:hypothetical protein A9179_05030 [Pseudomonas alcaligenes]|uniref:DNA polymerase III subunit chi n=1 Tax=Aquipseudomonas alcaligenes TaxID=43263 RepID=A0ABR7RZI1_AQUAC|nr:hypothetical protein [Pseudomonas alcaligenes]